MIDLKILHARSSFSRGCWSINSEKVVYAWPNWEFQLKTVGYTRKREREITEIFARLMKIQGRLKEVPYFLSIGASLFMWNQDWEKDLDPILLI